MKTQIQHGEPTELRRRAEQQLKKSGEEQKVRSGTKAEMYRLLHELHVHQIELEMQNEELIQARTEVEEILHQYTDLYDFAQVGYFTLDRDGTIRQVNLTGASLFGVERARLVNRSFKRFLSEDTRPVFGAFLDRAFASREKETCEATLLKGGKEPFYLEIEARVSEDGQECHAVTVDINERKRAELELKFLSIHDALTGLYHRGFFEEEMARIERGRQFPASIVMADVDGLKEMNDREGHAAGDALLKCAAQIMTAAFRAEDIVARIGGDEFAVLLPNTNAAVAAVALRRVRQILKKHNAARAGAPVSLSFGTSTAKKRMPLKDVLKAADENMYHEKRRNNVY